MTIKSLVVNSLRAGSRIDMRNRPRRGSHTSVTRTASLIAFIKVRERQLRGGISARRKDRLDRVELTDDPRLTANRTRQRTNVGTKEVGAKKWNGNGQEEIGPKLIESDSNFPR